MPRFGRQDSRHTTGNALHFHQICAAFGAICEQGGVHLSQYLRQKVVRHRAEVKELSARPARTHPAGDIGLPLPPERQRSRMGDSATVRTDS